MPPVPQLKFVYVISGINAGEDGAVAALSELIDDAVERLQAVIATANPTYSRLENLSSGASYTSDIESNVSTGATTATLTVALAGLSYAEMSGSNPGFTDLIVNTGSAVNGAVGDSSLDDLELAGTLHVVAVH